MSEWSQYSEGVLRKADGGVTKAVHDFLEGRVDSSAVVALREKCGYNSLRYFRTVYGNPAIGEDVVPRLLRIIGSFKSFKPCVREGGAVVDVEFSSDESRGDYEKGAKDVIAAGKKAYDDESARGGLNRIAAMNVGISRAVESLKCVGVLPFDKREDVKVIIERGKTTGVKPKVVI